MRSTAPARSTSAARRPDPTSFNLHPTAMLSSCLGAILPQWKGGSHDDDHDLRGVRRRPPGVGFSEATGAAGREPALLHGLQTGAKNPGAGFGGRDVPGPRGQAAASEPAPALSGCPPETGGSQELQRQLNSPHGLVLQFLGGPCYPSTITGIRTSVPPLAPSSR